MAAEVAVPLSTRAGGEESGGGAEPAHERAACEATPGGGKALGAGDLFITNRLIIQFDQTNGVTVLL